MYVSNRGFLNLFVYVCFRHLSNRRALSGSQPFSPQNKKLGVQVQQLASPRTNKASSPFKRKTSEAKESGTPKKRRRTMATVEEEAAVVGRTPKRRGRPPSSTTPKSAGRGKCASTGGAAARARKSLITTVEYTSDATGNLQKHETPTSYSLRRLSIIKCTFCFFL